MDVDARLEAVETENDMLRARVEQLEEQLGMRMAVPICFGLTGQEAKVFGVLMKRDLTTKEMIMLALYSNRPDDPAEIKIVDVFVCKIRAKLKAFDMRIETVWGQGYRLMPETKAAVRALMQEEGLAA